MKREMENNILGEMKEIKERLDSLAASLEENKDEGQLLTCTRDFQWLTHVYNSPTKVTQSVEHVSATFSLPDMVNLNIFWRSVLSDKFVSVAIF